MSSSESGKARFDPLGMYTRPEERNEMAARVKQFLNERRKAKLTTRQSLKNFKKQKKANEDAAALADMGFDDDLFDDDDLNNNNNNSSTDRASQLDEVLRRHDAERNYFPYGDYSVFIDSIGYIFVWLDTAMVDAKGTVSSEEHELMKQILLMASLYMTHKEKYDLLLFIRELVGDRLTENDIRKSFSTIMEHIIRKVQVVQERLTLWAEEIQAAREADAEADIEDHSGGRRRTHRHKKRSTHRSKRRTHIKRR